MSGRGVRLHGLAPIACTLILCGAHAFAGVRVEARSKHYFAVGIVEGRRLVIHLSQVADNGPVHDAAVRVALRGASLPAVAQPDGSYAVETPELSAPGEARIDFAVTRRGASETLSGVLRQSEPAEKATGTVRQLGWWVLNFAVCIGFLWLFSRRRKARAA